MNPYQILGAAFFGTIWTLLFYKIGKVSGKLDGMKIASIKNALDTSKILKTMSNEAKNEFHKKMKEWCKNNNIEL